MELKANIRELGNTKAEVLPIEILKSEHDPNPILSVSIRESIEESGLEYPITCWILRDEEHDYDIDDSVNLKSLVSRTRSLYGIEDVMYVIKAGNNRIAAALALGYTHIDCLVYDPFTIGGWDELVHSIRTCQSYGG